MPRVFIPPPLRRLTGGCTEVDVTGGTLRGVMDQLEARFPGVRDRLCEDDRIRPGFSVVIGAEMVGPSLLQPVPADAEVHFLRSVGGG